MSELPEQLTVLVCGGRQYSDAERVYAVLEMWRLKCKHLRIIEGGCRGADAFARKWALWQPFERMVSWSTYDADWRKYGKAAGPLRNQRMLDEGKPDLVLAFGGHSGTNDMIKRARKAGVNVIEIDRGTKRDADTGLLDRAGVR